jgi:hypothetical protein
MQFPALPANGRKGSGNDGRVFDEYVVARSPDYTSRQENQSKPLVINPLQWPLQPARGSIGEVPYTYGLN